MKQTKTNKTNKLNKVFVTAFGFLLMAMLVYGASVITNTKITTDIFEGNISCKNVTGATSNLCTISDSYDTAKEVRDAVNGTHANFNYIRISATDKITFVGNNVSIGNSDTKANTSSATAVGGAALAVKTGTSAYGYYSEASGVYSSAYGHDSVANASDTTSYGAYAEASDLYASSYGFESMAKYYASAYGYYSEARGQATSSYGAYSQVSGIYASGYGSYSNVSGMYGIGIGYKANATATGAITIGTDIQNDIANSVLIEGDTRLTGYLAVGSNLVDGLTTGDINASTIYYDTLTPKSPIFFETDKPEPICMRADDNHYVACLPKLIGGKYEFVCEQSSLCDNKLNRVNAERAIKLVIQEEQKQCTELGKNYDKKDRSCKVIETEDVRELN